MGDEQVELERLTRPITDPGGQRIPGLPELLESLRPSAASTSGACSRSRTSPEAWALVREVRGVLEALERQRRLQRRIQPFDLAPT